ncbi:MAG: repressor LexA [Candidatus Eisenbacteria bacterium]|nr:repressor LexA [Candidatus Eisenbacteria bacterium]
MDASMTVRQREVLELILESVRSGGRFPSVREIARGLGLRSPASVHAHLVALAERGYLQRAHRQWRLAPHVRQEPRIPILGRVAAGLPEISEGQIEGHLSADALGLGAGHYGIRVSGESMSGEGILDGDIVVVAPGRPIHNGDLVVAALGDQEAATVKRFFRFRGGVELRAAHPDYPSVRLRGSAVSLRVLGRVVGLWRAV